MLNFHSHKDSIKRILNKGENLAKNAEEISSVFYPSNIEREVSLHFEGQFKRRFTSKSRSLNLSANQALMIGTYGLTILRE